MEGLEDKFVAGEWIPPFLELSPTPPKRKRKDNTEQQKRKKTKKPEKKKSNDNNITLHYII